MRRTPLVPVAVAAFALLGTAFPAHAVDPEVVAENLVSPLSVAVTPDGTAFASQNFIGTLTRATPGGSQEVIYADEDSREVGAVSVEHGMVTFATTAMHGPQEAKLWVMDGMHGGEPTQVANLFRHEKMHNPDGDIRYGFTDLSRSCRRNTEGRETYTGIVESHPYASDVVADGITFVADAAANALLAVSDDGTVSTVAVLPPNKLKITKRVRRHHDLPACFLGGTWKAESVPTDVETGPDGNLYVTSLPGGHETNGKVFQVNPTTGAVVEVMDGLVGPTGLAVAPDGTAYVAALFMGVILQKPLGGDVSVFAEVPFPGDVEVIDGFVYATETDLMNDGSTPPAGRVLRWPTAD